MPIMVWVCQRICGMVADVKLIATPGLAAQVRTAMRHRSQEMVKAQGGPSGPTMTKLLRGDGSPIAPDTARKLEHALGWSLGETTERAATLDPTSDLPLGEQLAMIRDVVGWSPAQLAKLLGVGPGTLAKWEAGAPIPESRMEGLGELFGPTTSPAVAADAIRAASDLELLAELTRRAVLRAGQ